MGADCVADAGVEGGAGGGHRLLERGLGPVAAIAAARGGVAEEDGQRVGSRRHLEAAVGLVEGGGGLGGGGGGDGSAVVEGGAAGGEGVGDVGQGLVGVAAE